jgi:hypothetical protein
MKHLNFTRTLLFLLMANTSLFSQKLSESTKVSLITVAPGNELNDSFGHTLLWIYDPTSGVDKAYNFGEYDYDTENFYWKFDLGQMPNKKGYYPLNLY